MEHDLGPDMPKLWTRRSVLLALAGVGLATPACTVNQLFSWNHGKPVIFGYGTAPNYDRRFKTIHLQIFKNPTFWAVVPVPGLEMELTACRRKNSVPRPSRREVSRPRWAAPRRRRPPAIPCPARPICPVRPAVRPSPPPAPRR
jgi:hypothetical protein